MAFWTYWLMAAIAVFVAELFLGTVYLLVLSASLTGGALASFLGFGTTTCILITAVLAALGTYYIYITRRTRSLKVYISNDNDLDLGECVFIEQRLSADLWRVHYRGAIWEAQSVSPHDFQAGQRARICGKNGIVLLIEAI